MAGATHQIQIRHILLDKKEVADLLKETIESLPNETARVQMLMKLAGKYSIVSPIYLCRRQLLKLFFHFWHSLEQVGYQAVIGNLEDRGFLVLIDGDNHFAVFHAG